MMTKAQRINWDKFCSEPLELVESYAAAKADNFAGWCIHHRLEIQPDGTRVSKQQLIDQGLYFGRPASELIFMREPEHKRLHITIFNKDRTFSEETRLKMSAAAKGKHKSADTRQKMSKSHKGKKLGVHWWNDGVSCKLARECPGEGWTRGRLSFGVKYYI